jgi:hypothetical protein
MSDILIGVIVFGLVFGAAIFGMFLGRNLRVLEQKVNASGPSFAEASTFAEATARQDGVPSKLSEADKFDLQQYVARCEPAQWTGRTAEEPQSAVSSPKSLRLDPLQLVKNLAGSMTTAGMLPQGAPYAGIGIRIAKFTKNCHTNVDEHVFKRRNSRAATRPRHP